MIEGGGGGVGGKNSRKGNYREKKFVQKIRAKREKKFMQKESPIVTFI